ncbi:MAG: 1-acyl-sn-glycerol-3-phosphate acyltransferase [Verrucomicrobia bacterium]|nr:1-acyl-sn-glycerol-3-phosphate acyltransferase [Verrucomicrobiota bacterium]
MANNSKFEEKVQAQAWMSEKVKRICLTFYQSFAEVLTEHRIPLSSCHQCFEDLLQLIKTQHLTPFVFQPFHEKIRYPFDYYQFGKDFFSLLIDVKASEVHGHPHIEEVISHLKQGHNVVFLANHQIEADPQAISILLDEKYPKLAENMIFVAGERVITDPLAIPFSMGRNLLCIYSKRYIDHPPEKKAEKQHHNKRAMELMCLLLKEGGKCIYVAPSGGRDRRNAQGVVEVAPFDPQSIEMFYLMAQKAKTPTYFYPMALATYHLLPPPEAIQIELGEARHGQRGPAHLSVGPCIDMERYPGYDQSDKHARRQARADHIWNLVSRDYQMLVKGVP